MLAPMTRDDIENCVLETVAEATVAGTPPARAILGSRGAEIDPVLEFLIDRAVTGLVQDLRKREKLELKVLRLDPEHYTKLEQARATAATPRSKASLRRDAITAEKHAAAQERFIGHAKKMIAALSFYETWKMSDGTHLGDATKTKLLADSTRERSHGKGHMRNAAFYAALAKKLTGDQTVNDVVPLEDAHKLRERIYA